MHNQLNRLQTRVRTEPSGTQEDMKFSHSNYKQYLANPTVHIDRLKKGKHIHQHYFKLRTLKKNNYLTNSINHKSSVFQISPSFSNQPHPIFQERQLPICKKIEKPIGRQNHTSKDKDLFKIKRELRRYLEKQKDAQSEPLEYLNLNYSQQSEVASSIQIKKISQCNKISDSMKKRRRRLHDLISQQRKLPVGVSETNNLSINGWTQDEKTFGIFHYSQ